MGKLDGKVAAVTGGGRGIGRAVCKLLAAEGAAVVVNDLGVSVAGEKEPSSPAEALAGEINVAGGRAVADDGDISTKQGGSGLVEHATRQFGKLDILVNAAGILRDRSIFAMTEEEWDSVIRVHLRGHFCTIQAASLHMRERGLGGRIINFSSGAAFGAPGQPNYGAAKAGIIGLTFSCALMLAKYNITVNAVFPTAATRMVDAVAAFMPEEEAREILDQLDPLERRELIELRDYLAPTRAELSRLGGGIGNAAAEDTALDPAHVAPLVVFLASDEAYDINGQCFGAAGYQISHYAPPHVDKTLVSGGPWTIDQLFKLFKPTFGTNLRPPLYGARSTRRNGRGRGREQLG